MGKENKDFLSKIPGVKSGFRKGESVETARERLAARVRAEMPEAKVDLLVIKKSKQDFLELPTLSQSRIASASWVPRADEFGSVYTTRWEDVAMKETEEEKKSLKIPDDFVVFRKPSHRKEVDLSSFPKGWSVAWLVPQKLRTIEDAMRQQDEIRRDYASASSIEQSEIEDVLAGIQDLTEDFLYGGMTRDRLEQMSEEAVSMFEAAGINLERAGAKQRIYERVMRATKEDRLGRVNPLVSRVLLRSAYLSAVKREVLVRLSREKANRIYNFLYIERAVTREALANASDAISTLAGFEDNIGEQVLTEADYYQDPSLISTEDINELRHTLNQIVQTDLRQARVQPYLLTSVVAENMLTSFAYKRPRYDKLRVQGILTHFGMKGELDNLSAEDYIRARKPWLAVSRMRNAKTFIDETLNDPETNDYKIFD